LSLIKIAKEAFRTVYSLLNIETHVTTSENCSSWKAETRRICGF